MRTVRLYDPSREPRDWSGLIQPGQFVIFASFIDGGGPCTVDGRAEPHAEATCVFTDALEEAEALATAHAVRHRDVRYDVFDARGRSKPALLTIVHPDRRRRIEGNGATRRRNRAIAMAFFASVPVLIWIDWWWAGGALVLPSLLAFNGLLFAIWLLQVTAGEAAAERRRQDRLAGRDESR